ncbi:MAG: hypothetical protein FJ319_07130 [SAR202 cluster bacterium]|nr:hypothetical protein [SAR202 cluster bacterium]
MRKPLILIVPLLALMSACGEDPAPADAPSPTAAAPAATATVTPVPPTPTPSVFVPPPLILPTVAAPTRSPTPVPDEPFAKALDAAGLKMNAIRQLSLTAGVDRDFISNTELRTLFDVEFEKSKADLESQQRLLVALGLMAPDGPSLYDTMYGLSTEGILGFFDAEKEKMYVVSERPDLTLADERTYVHEFVHALQQANFDTATEMERRKNDSDGQQSLRALIEGDAVLAEYIYLSQHFDEAKQIASEPQTTPELEAVIGDAPYIVLRQFIFPYVQGLEFAVALYREGQWEAINNAFRNPPASSEQVIHPEKYLAGEVPVRVILPDVTWVLGNGWKRDFMDNGGELFLRSYLENGLDPNLAAVASTGWGGDALAMYTGPEGKTVVTLPIVWDTERDAQEFFEAYLDLNELIANRDWEPVTSNANSRTMVLPSRAISIERNGLMTIVAIAPDVVLLDTVRQALAFGLRSE